jgi:hypothetical protein
VNDSTYILIFGCNGIKSTLVFATLVSAYEYIIVHKLEQSVYELYRAEKIINNQEAV